MALGFLDFDAVLGLLWVGFQLGRGDGAELVLGREVSGDATASGFGLFVAAGFRFAAARFDLSAGGGPFGTAWSWRATLAASVYGWTYIGGVGAFAFSWLARRFTWTTSYNNKI